MERTVFQAILAMDSNNRSYGQNVGGLPESGQIGNATIRPFEEGEQAGWQAAGFFAIAYNWNGQTVISYRGTNFEIDWSINDFLNSPAVRDAWSGHSLGGALVVNDNMLDRVEQAA